VPIETRASSRATHHARSAYGGPEGNERLTAITGTILLALFAIEGVTILRIGRLLYWHYLFGFLLLGPVCLKCCSTVYRFFQYYTRDREYVRKGPPQPLLRLLGPIVMLTTIGVFATGVALGVEGYPKAYFGFSLLLLHKGFFILWAGAMTIHVLAYLWRLPRLVGADLKPTRGGRVAVAVGGRGLRWSVAGLALGAGTVLALATVHLSSSWHH
jgi:hypothetical protein